MCLRISRNLHADRPDLPNIRPFYAIFKIDHIALLYCKCHMHLIMNLLMSNELKRMWKEAVMIWFEVLSLNLHGRSKENY
jgi:hypothetical protein